MVDRVDTVDGSNPANQLIWYTSNPLCQLIVGNFWTINIISSPRAFLEVSSKFFVEADFTKKTSDGCWNMLRSGYLHVDQLVVTEATEADATLP